MANWNSISGMIPPTPIRQFNGLYVPNDQGFDMNESMFTWMMNFGSNHYPAMSTSVGYEYKTDGIAFGMGVWKDKEVHIITSLGDWKKCTPPANIWTTIATGLDTSKEWTFCNFKGNFSDVNLIASNGVGAIRKYDGSTVSVLANAPANADFICTHSNRLYCAFENTVYFSGLNKPEDWTTVDDAGSINVDTTDGEYIIGLNPGVANLTIFKNSSLYELYGKGPTSYQLYPVAADIGAINNKSITYHDDVIYFISRDGLYKYAGGVRPNKIWSIPVHNLIVGMDNLFVNQMCAEATERNIYFTILYNLEKITINYNTQDGTFSLMNNVQPWNMLRFKKELYIGDGRDMIVTLEGKTNNGDPIESVAITKPFTAELISQRQEWYKLWVVASMDEGSIIKIYISPSDTGNNWGIINTIEADTALTYKELLVPLHSVSGSHAVRLKIEATGYVQIHEITRQTRQMPLRR